MTKNIWPVLIVLALVVGVFAGAYGFPTTDTKTITVEKPVPYEVIKNVSVEVPVPVEFYKPAVKDLLNYLDDEDLLTCDGTDYKLSEVSVLKTYADYSVAFDKDEYTVDGKVKLSFKESDEKRCTDTFEFSVLYEEDEEPEVSLI